MELAWAMTLCGPLGGELLEEVRADLQAEGEPSLEMQGNGQCKGPAVEQVE